MTALPQKQHEDIKECFDILKTADEQTIQALAAACDHDNSLLLKLRLYLENTPEYGEDEAKTIKDSAQIRRNNRRDWFATGKVLAIVYSQQQRQVLRDVIDKVDQLQQYRRLQAQRAQMALFQDQANSMCDDSAATNATNQQPLDPNAPQPPTPPTAPQFRLFVGGIDPSVTDQEFRSTFALFPAIKHTNMPPNPTDKTKRRGFGFVEFLTYYGLEQCLVHHQRTPFQFRGKVVDIQIPKDIIAPLQEWLTLQQQYETDLIAFNKQYNPGAVVISNITGAVLGAIADQTSSMNDIAGGNTTSSIDTAALLTQLQDIPEHQLPRSDPAGTVICIANMFSQPDKDDIDSGELPENDLKEEILPQFQQFGLVKNTLLRFTIGVQAKDDADQQQTYYPVFVQYNTNEEATKALQGLGGLTFDGRKLYAYLTTQIPQ